MITSFSDMRAFRRDFLGFVRERSAASDDAFIRLRLGPQRVWLLNDPAFIKPVLMASEDTIDKGRLIHKLRPIVGNSMLVLSGPEHRRRRNALHGLLAKGNALRFAPHMAALVQEQMAQILRAGGVFDPHPACARLALRMICLVLFGRNVLTAGDEQALTYAVGLAEDDLAKEIFQVLPSPPWSAARRKRRRAEALAIMSEVVNRISARAEPGSAVDALHKLELPASDIRDEILTALLAGHHTTGTAAAWVLYHLGAIPELAGEITVEAAQVYTASGEIDPTRLTRAGRSQSLVKEVLRLYPSSHWFSRDVKQATTLGGTAMQRGDTILISPWQLHRDARHWDRPNDFDLDRDFTSKAYVPFGAGPRACLGMGVAMLELQIIALEFGSAFAIDVRSGIPAAMPRPSVTLLPPKLELELRLTQAPIATSVAAE